MADFSRWVAISIFLVIFLGRSLHLRLGQGTQICTIVVGKPLPEALLEGLFLLAFPLWVLNLVWHAWPSATTTMLDIEIFTSGKTAWMGAGLELSSIAIFAAALVSFGASWRVDCRPALSDTRRGVLSGRPLRANLQQLSTPRPTLFRTHPQGEVGKCCSTTRNGI